MLPAIQMPGPFELVLILAVVLIVFGAGRLPDVFGQMGKGIKAFKDAQKEGDPTDVTPPKAIAHDERVAEAQEVKKERA